MIVLVPVYSATDEECFTCHEDPELKTGEGKYLFVASEKFLSSVHGRSGISCVDCHSDLHGFENFPHSEKLKSVSCDDCHQRAAEEFIYKNFLFQARQISPNFKQLSLA